jgi:hypothetical protein
MRHSKYRLLFAGERDSLLADIRTQAEAAQAAQVIFFPLISRIFNFFDQRSFFLLPLSRVITLKLPHTAKLFVR